MDSDAYFLWWNTGSLAPESNPLSGKIVEFPKAFSIFFLEDTSILSSDCWPFPPLPYWTIILCGLVVVPERRKRDSGIGHKWTKSLQPLSVLTSQGHTHCAANPSAKISPSPELAYPTICKTKYVTAFRLIWFLHNFLWRPLINNFF